MTPKSPPDCERHDYKVYKLGGLIYVPHYRNPNAYVGPGYPRWTANTYSRVELMDAGAHEFTMALFPRGTTAARNWND